MSQSDEVSSALENLQAIKQGEDPRSPEKTEQQGEPTDALRFAESEVARLYDEHDFLELHVHRFDVNVGVARWEGRNGVCKYNCRLPSKRRFGKRMTSLTRKTGEHAIIINERIFEQGNHEQFLDTVRHELAHVICYAKHGKYPSRKKYDDYDPEYKSHGDAWKRMARRIGADPNSCHNKRDRSDEYDYYLGCPNCGNEWGKTKRSKVIKQPFNRKCECGQTPLCSYDAGDDMPEAGVVSVESLPWDNKSEWIENGAP